MTKAYKRTDQVGNKTGMDIHQNNFLLSMLAVQSKLLIRDFLSTVFFC